MNSYLSLNFPNLFAYENFLTSKFLTLPSLFWNFKALHFLHFFLLIVVFISWVFNMFTDMEISPLVVYTGRRFDRWGKLLGDRRPSSLIISTKVKLLLEDVLPVWKGKITAAYQKKSSYCPRQLQINNQPRWWFYQTISQFFFQICKQQISGFNGVRDYINLV